MSCRYHFSLVGLLTVFHYECFRRSGFQQTTGFKSVSQRCCLHFVTCGRSFSIPAFWCPLHKQIFDEFFFLEPLDWYHLRPSYFCVRRYTKDWTQRYRELAMALKIWKNYGAANIIRIKSNNSNACRPKFEIESGADPFNIPEVATFCWWLISKCCSRGFLGRISLSTIFTERTTPSYGPSNFYSVTFDNKISVIHPGSRPLVWWNNDHSKYSWVSLFRGWPPLTIVTCV